jgi:translation initiation factor IF-2
MTDENDKKPGKLTLNTGKLSLNKKVDSGSLRQNYMSRSNNVTVEVKKSASTMFSSTKSDTNTGSLTNSEFSKRLDIIRKASHQAELAEKASLVDNSLIGSLSDFGIERVEENSLENEDVIINSDEDDNKNLSKKHSHFTKVEEDTEAVDELKKNYSKTPATKNKIEEPKKLKKADIFHMLDADDSDAPMRTRSLASIKRAKAKEKRKAQEQIPQEKVYREVVLPEVITVSDLALRMTERVSDVIRELMKLGIIASASQSIDADTAEIVATGFGHTVKRIQESDVENILQVEEDKPEALKPRSPVVTVMGHVDHGKTSLLDALKLTDVVAGEAGGITQHIGAYKVHLANHKSITFIDTPGHEAFTEMRTRGAKVTDIVILVVAADDGIKAQTVEAINHAKAANVPIIVAVNKMDKPDADLNRVKNELLQYELVSEDLGGDVIVVPVSALKRQNLDKLEEAILLIAEMADLKANYETSASGTVIESKIDKGKGVIATILVQRGTLKVGDLVVAGGTSGRVRLISNDKGTSISKAGPSDPVEIYGLEVSPLAGDQFDVVKTEKNKHVILLNIDYVKRKKRRYLLLKEVV